MRFDHRLLFTVLLAGVVMLAGCESDDSGGGSPAQVAGTWSLTQSFSTGRVVTFPLTLAQNNRTLTGSSRYGEVNGSVTGTSVEFTIRDEDLKTFTGSASGATMSGTFTENFEDELFREGNWTAVRTAP